jgi:hypothetical protein
MTTLTVEQTTDMLADLAAGDLDDVFSQDELQRFFDRADSDYNTAVYYGWRQILANSASWVDYRVAQTQVSRSQAFDHIYQMLSFWQNESRTAANQLVSLGISPVPTTWKPSPGDAYPRSTRRNRSHSNWRDW